MSDSFTNVHVAGISQMYKNSILLPHIGGTVHSNRVICLDSVIRRSFLQGKSMLCNCLPFYSIKMFPTAKYIGIDNPEGMWQDFSPDPIVTLMWSANHFTVIFQ